MGGLTAARNLRKAKIMKQEMEISIADIAEEVLSTIASELQKLGEASIAAPEEGDSGLCVRMSDEGAMIHMLVLSHLTGRLMANFHDISGPDFVKDMMEVFYTHTADTINEYKGDSK